MFSSRSFKSLDIVRNVNFELLLYVWFACMHVFALCACLVLMEARRHEIPYLELQMVVLRLELRSCERAANALNH